MIAGGVDPQLARTGADLLNGEICGQFVAVITNGVRAYKNLKTDQIIYEDFVAGSAASKGELSLYQMTL